MAISYVNGFLCRSCCDVAKAKRGVDPHPKADGSDPAKPDTTNGVVTNDKNVDDKGAVVLGGSLASATGATAVAPVSAVQASVPANVQTQGLVLNLLV